MSAPTDICSHPRWPGLDHDFHQALLDVGCTPEGRDLRERAEDRFMFTEGKPFLLGPAQMVCGEWAERLRTVTRAYHRAIETIVRASLDDEAVRDMLSTPPALAEDLAADRHADNMKVHICRLDLMLDPAGTFWILETNANCPGGFVFSGICNRAWREFMEERGYPMPPALRHEDKGFMAKWFLEVVRQDTGEDPEHMVLFREEGGNRLELEDFAKHVRWEGLTCDEVDPREVEYDGSGTPVIRGKKVRHAYQKLGMQRYLHHRADLEPFVQAVRNRALFVQNGQRGRWVGDDKLCLAILSDPKFRYLFDEDDWSLLQEHVPWSRNARLLDATDMAEVRGNRARFVLKRGLDTRGQGVVVGRGVDADAWGAAVDRATAEGWLVQDFHPTSWIERDFGDPTLQRHDLALGAINGELTTLFSRSSSELRVNMARTGRMHPVFLGACPESPVSPSAGTSP